MYTRIRELLEQVLLEFDPKQENFGGRKHNRGRTISRQSAAGTTAFLGSTERGDRAMKKANNNSNKDRELVFKAAKKADNRQLSRGGEATPRVERSLKVGTKRVDLGKRKISGPKGKLPK